MNTTFESRLVGNITISCAEPNGWNLSAEIIAYANPAVECLQISLDAPSDTPPPSFTVSFSVPLDGACHRWTWNTQSCSLPPDWGSDIDTNIACGLPVCSFVRPDDSNRLTTSCSETARVLRLNAGVNEETACIIFKYRFFTAAEAPIRSYRATIRLDARAVPFSTAVREAAAWLDSLPGNTPAVPPSSAFEPLYSSWYGFHQSVFADQIEAECAEAAKDGMKVIIVDDGWETDDNNRGFAFTGDWEVSPNRFPDMRAHVDRVHAIGLKYMLWFAVSFVGFKSRNHARFAGKYLYDIPHMGASVLDPRFPEVREFLAATYERALRAWDLDGLKLDFIDSFRIQGSDPAEKDDYAGRDFKSVPEAVRELFALLRKRLDAVKPDLLIEFRQNYIGPAIRTFGNMMRAADCPADAFTNHTRIANLRLTSGVSAVHSDMLEWHPDEPVETAAMQVLACLFGVIQYSMRLAALPADHREMVRHWLRFTTAHRNALLHGGFTPHGAVSGYTSLEGWDANERIVALYAPDTVCDVTDTTRDTYVVNATPLASIPLRLYRAPDSAEVFDTLGQKVATPVLTSGLQDCQVPSGGYAVLKWKRAAAIVDLDGVMLDSLGVWREIDTDFVHRYGIANPDTVIDRLQRIPSLIDAGNYLHNECGVPKTPQAIADEFVELLGEHYRNTLQLFPGVTDKLRALKDAGLKLAMVTASPEVHAKPAAERTGILGFFDEIYYDEPKTTPDVFLRAVRDLGTTIADTIVIDDNAAIRPIAESAGFRTRSAL
jgi:alpha-galactosidase